MVVVTDHDSKVLARKSFRCRAWDLGVALDWAAERATAKGFAGVTVSCEPTGHRWRLLGQFAGDRSMPFVCVQTMQTSRARRSEGLTFDKTDDKDAILIARLTARLTAQLRCYVPEPIDETRGGLRHLGARRTGRSPGRPNRASQQGSQTPHRRRRRVPQPRRPAPARRRRPGRSTRRMAGHRRTRLPLRTLDDPARKQDPPRRWPNPNS